MITQKFSQESVRALQERIMGDWNKVQVSKDNTIDGRFGPLTMDAIERIVRATDKTSVPSSAPAAVSTAPTTSVAAPEATGTKPGEQAYNDIRAAIRVKDSFPNLVTLPAGFEHFGDFGKAVIIKK